MPSRNCFHRLLSLVLIILGIGNVVSAQMISPNCSGMSIITFKIFNSELPVDSILKKGTVELSNELNSFTIGYQLTDSLQNTDYYYKLGGFDKDWTKASKTGVLNYTVLPPGQYVFTVKCENSAAGMSREYVLLRVNIKLPFWLSPWFIIACFLAFVGIIYYFHSLSIKRLMAIESVRQKVSRDLHDDIGSTLSTINILSMMAKSKLAEDPAKSVDYLNKIGDNSSQMMEALDDIVWSINPANDNMQKIMARMRSFATEVLEPKNVDLHFHFDEELKNVHLNMEERRDLFLLFKESVNNAAKYSNATLVSVDMHIKNKILQLKVQDNGIGFNSNEADTGNGLNNMQKRAEKLKAKYSISSQPGDGTVMLLEMQIT